MKEIINKKEFWYVVGGLLLVIILFIVISKVKNTFSANQYKGVKNITLSSGETIDESTGQAYLDETKRKILEDLAGVLYDDIENTPISGHDYTPYEAAYALSDSELWYVADFYKRQLASGESFYSAMNSEFYSWSSVPEQIMSRLKQIGAI